jgi:hypothetical protein
MLNNKEALQASRKAAEYILALAAGNEDEQARIISVMAERFGPDVLVVELASMTMECLHKLEGDNWDGALNLAILSIDEE